LSEELHLRPTASTCGFKDEFNVTPLCRLTSRDPATPFDPSMSSRFPSAGIFPLIPVLLLTGCAAPRPANLPSLTDLSGQSRPIHVGHEVRAIALVTLSVDCPLSNKVLPELRRLEERFGQRGIRFVHLYPNTDESADAVKAHRTEFGIPAIAYRDPAGEWVRRFGLDVTPQALVVTPAGELVYRGRIHDQFLSLGTGKPAATRHDLEEALAQFDRNGEAAGVTTKAIGCRIRIHPPLKSR
jgi:hypothetical protein